MNILMVASESNPFSKSGGLADVCYSLSKEMAQKDNDVAVMLPLYKTTKEKWFDKLFYLGYLYIDISNRHEYVGLYQYIYDKVVYYFIDNELYFGRERLYGYSDDILRFSYFDMAVCSAIKYLNLKLDVVHVHDHQAGMIPLLLRDYYKYRVKTVLTIHNPAFQGTFDPSRLNELFNMDKSVYDNGLVRFNNECSMLKAAIMVVDKITTVSPNHRNELSSFMYDYGLSHVLKYRLDDFVGIVNGVDYKEFDPENDSLIKYHFTKNNLRGKYFNKLAFSKEYGFDPKKPLYGLVSRLSFQKGIELLVESLKKYKDEINVFILGSGEEGLEDKVKALCDNNPNIKCYIGYSDSLAHKVYAASDFFFMPSLYEPCGIGQMIAHTYGSLPLVRETGGLKDTVDDLVDGIRFVNFDTNGLNYAINKSLEIYNNKDLFRKMKKAAINKDHSWALSCDEYLNLYKSIK